MSSHFHIVKSAYEFDAFGTPTLIRKPERGRYARHPVPRTLNPVSRTSHPGVDYFCLVDPETGRSQLFSRSAILRLIGGDPLLGMCYLGPQFEKHVFDPDTFSVRSLERPWSPLKPDRRDRLRIRESIPPFAARSRTVMDCAKLAAGWQLRRILGRMPTHAEISKQVTSWYRAWRSSASSAAPEKP